MTEAGRVRLRAKLVLAAVSTVLVLLLLEGALRVVLPREAMGWRGVPPVEERVRAFGSPEPGALRIVGLGDSFTEFLDESGGNWLREVERAVAAEGTAVAAVNLAQMGTSPKHYLHNLERYGAALRPKLVLLGLYVGNDLVDYEVDLQRDARGQPRDPVRTQSAESDGLAAKLSRASVLATMGARAARRLLPAEHTVLERNLAFLAELYGLDDERMRALRSGVDPATWSLAQQERINPWDLAWALVRPRRYLETMALQGRVPEALSAMLNDVDKIAARTRELGATLVVLLIPTGPQIDPRYDDYLRMVGYELSDAVREPTPLTHALAAAFDQRGIAFVDPTSALRVAGEPLYLPQDTHWTTAAQRVAGQALHAALKRGGLLVTKP